MAVTGQQISFESAAGDSNRPGAGLDFEVLLRRYQSMVFSCVLHHLGDAGVAEEVAQDVFLRLHAELPRIQSEAHAVSWLRRVAVHRAIDASRSGHFRRTVHLEGAVEASQAASPPDVLMQRALRRLLATLPDAQRMALILRYQEDLEPAEIAGVLGAPVATVKSHLRRGLAMLREKTQTLWDKQP
ncbi:MAG: RNA polymerase sigma factor [Bryobacterales bacterium]|nr:RNA polymerase sigma factor [Bryobacterales bacterium]